jgi:RNA polymerase sigma-70 factor (ECF subfamily)
MKPTNLNFRPISRNQFRPCAHPQSVAEKELLARARAGDQVAFGELCKRSEPRLLRMARHIVRNEEDARDAVQEALLNAYLNLSRFDERSSFSTWATRIAINSSLMQLRKRKHSFLPLTDDAPEDSRMEDPAPTPEALLAGKDERRLLKDAIRSLPQNLRTVVELKQFQERSMQELASELSITCSAAKARFFRAKEMLKTRLLRDLRCRSSFGAEVIPISRTETRDKRKHARTLIAEVTRRIGLAEIA